MSAHRSSRPGRRASRFRQILAWAGAGWSDQSEPFDVEKEAREARERRRTQTRLADFGPDEHPRQGRGLVLGRFLPPHKGHQYLLDVARTYCAELTVVVFGGAADGIAPEQRVAWLREMAPGARVVSIAEIGGAAARTADLEKDTALRDKLIKFAQADVLISSDVHGAALAKKLRARHLLLDAERKAVDVSGTRIRENPLVQWDFLPDCVRPHYVTRVRLLGPESTGKSTLALRLAKHFNTVMVPEYARTMRRMTGRELFPGDIQTIARMQLAGEDALARRANRLLICDTDLLSLRLWSERLFGMCPEWIAHAADDRRYDATLVLEPDAPFQGDRSFDEPERRRQFFLECRKHARDHVVVNGDWEERFERALVVTQNLRYPPK